MYATNNSSPTIAELPERLATAGIEATADEIVTSAQATASMLEPGSTAVACADGGVLEALAARGVSVVGKGPADAVVVGWTRRFDFDLLATAATAVRHGARLIGTNEDPTHPTPRGLLPGSGALLAAVAAAARPPPRWRASRMTPGGTAAHSVPPPRRSWWATGPPPTAPWHVGSGSSRWCGRVSPLTAASPWSSIPTMRRPTSRPS